MIIWYQEDRVGSTRVPFSYESTLLYDDPKKSLEQLGADRLLLLDQVHGSECLELSDTMIRQVEFIKEIGKADAMIVDKIIFSHWNKTALGIRTADCLAVVMEFQSKVALLHAGWRGLAAGVIEKVISKASDGLIKVFIAPAAKACCYEVGPEVLLALGLENKTKIDLQSIAVERIKSAVGTVLIEIDEACTICSDNLHSFRRNKTKSRNLTFFKF